MEVEFAEAEIGARRGRLGRDALRVESGVDDVADGPPLIADVAVMIIDHPEAAVGLGIGHSPKPIVGRCAIYEPAHGALGLDPLGVDRMVPEAHRLGIGEASVHSFCVLVTELAQAKTTSREYRVRRGFLCHVGGSCLTECRYLP